MGRFLNEEEVQNMEFFSEINEFNKRKGPILFKYILGIILLLGIPSGIISALSVFNHIRLGFLPTFLIYAPFYAGIGAVTKWKNEKYNDIKEEIKREKARIIKENEDNQNCLGQPLASDSKLETEQIVEHVKIDSEKSSTLISSFSTGNNSRRAVHAIRTENGIKCPNCGIEQKGNRTVCWNCSTLFISESNESSAPPQTDIEDNQQYIKTCDSEESQSDVETLKQDSTLPQDTHETATKESRIRFCHKCGNSLSEDSEFCGKCGTKVIG